MSIVCDSIFRCEGWESSYYPIKSAVEYCYTKGMLEHIKPYKFCPWCGREIKWDPDPKEV